MREAIFGLLWTNDCIREPVLSGVQWFSPVVGMHPFDLALLGNADDEDKSEQFLGVAMESRNGGFAVWKQRL